MLLRHHESTATDLMQGDAGPIDPPIPYARVLVIGGGGVRNGNVPDKADGGSGDSLEWIDYPPLTGPPIWVNGPNLKHVRGNVNVVLLPDDTVLVCGGVDGTINSEIYDPDTNAWIEVAPLKYARRYHSIALLLPSGKVVTTGGSTSDELKIELYSPPYLFRGPRPSYTMAPTELTYDKIFTIKSPDTCRIKKVGFMRPSAVTHELQSMVSDGRHSARWTCFVSCRLLAHA